MKVTGPGDAGKIGFPPKTKKDGIKGGPGFGNILAEEKDKLEGAKNQKISQTAKVKGPEFPSDISLKSLEAAGKIGGATDQQKAILLTEQVLARLDFFKSALGSTKLNMGKFSPLIETLKIDVKNLEEISSKMLSHPKLKSLTDETATLAALEVMKFDRGDYGSV